MATAYPLPSTQSMTESLLHKADDPWLPNRKRDPLPSTQSMTESLLHKADDPWLPIRKRSHADTDSAHAKTQVRHV